MFRLSVVVDDDDVDEMIDVDVDVDVDVDDLNKWDTSANPMQKRKNGDSSIAFNLELDWAMLMSHYKDYSYVFRF